MRLSQAMEILSGHHIEMIEETVPISDAAGRICAKDIHSPYDLPNWPISAMDGFAVRFGTKNEFQVIGQLNAGDEGIIPLEANQAIRINTGAVVPDETDAVIKIEDIEFVAEDIIRPTKRIKVGENIIKKGENAKRGSLTIREGQVLSAAELSTLRSFGRFSVKVRQKPTIGLLNTGDELLDAPPIPRGKIIESNSIMLIDMIRNSFCTPIHFGFALDKKDQIEKTLAKMLLQSDILLVIGGTSKGTRDLIPEILDERGQRLFKGLDISPGKPVGAWKVGGKMVFSLPGYPVACYLTYRYIVRPYILDSLGISPFDRQTVTVRAKMGEPVKSKQGRLQFVRVKLQMTDKGIVAIPIAKYGASNIMSLTMADGILKIPEDTTEIDMETEVDVELIRQPFL